MNNHRPASHPPGDNPPAKVVKSDAEWRSLLTPQEYHVTRQHGTEPPFTGPYLNEKRKGTYVCISCGNPLFDSGTKYDSRSGWPSFYAPLSKHAVAEHTDPRRHAPDRSALRGLRSSPRARFR